MNRVQQPCERNWCPKKGIVFAGSYGSEINPMSRFIRLFIIIIIENIHWSGLPLDFIIIIIEDQTVYW